MHHLQQSPGPLERGAALLGSHVGPWVSPAAAAGLNPKRCLSKRTCGFLQSFDSKPAVPSFRLWTIKIKGRHSNFATKEKKS